LQLACLHVEHFQQEVLWLSTIKTLHTVHFQ
jgi:hypothetical protein